MVKVMFDNEFNQYVLINKFRGEEDLIYTHPEKSKVETLYSNINNQLEKENELWISSLLSKTNNEVYYVNEPTICKRELSRFLYLSGDNFIANESEICKKELIKFN